MRKKISKISKDKRYQIPFRFDEDFRKDLDALKKSYGESTWSKTLKQSVRDAMKFKKFKQDLENSIKKEIKLDPKFVKENLGFQFSDYI